MVLSRVQWSMVAERKCVQVSNGLKEVLHLQVESNTDNQNIANRRDDRQVRH